MTQAEFLAQMLDPYDSETIREATRIWHENMARKAEIATMRRTERKAEQTRKLGG